MSDSLIGADVANIANSGPSTFVLLSSDGAGAAAAVVLLPAVEEGCGRVVRVGRGAGQGERRPQRDRVVRARVDDRNRVAGRRGDALVRDRAALVGLAREPRGAGAEVLHAEQDRVVEPRQRAGIGDLEARVAERAAAEARDCRGGAGRQDRRQRGEDAGRRVVRAVHDRRREVSVVVQRERVVRAAVVRLVDRAEAAAAAEVREVKAAHRGRPTAPLNVTMKPVEAAPVTVALPGEAGDRVDRGLDVRVVVRLRSSRRSRSSRGRRS